MAKATIQDQIGSTSQILTIEIARQFDSTSERSAIREAMKLAAEKFATKWVEENHDKILERLNVDAIANMIMLEVTKDIKKEILKKTDD